MQDSNQFHSVCLDTYPPIFYLNDISSSIIQLITAYNQHHKQTRAAYTFDAGPNAVLYLLKKDVPDVLRLILHFFPPSSQQDSSSYFNNHSLLKEINVSDLRNVDCPSGFNGDLSFTPRPGCLQFVQHTTLGEGPQVLDLGASLLDKSGELIQN